MRGGLFGYTFMIGDRTLIPTMKKQALTIETLMALGFLALIALGTLLLSLPAAWEAGVSHTPVDALFTATSAVCVTGLSLVDVGKSFTLFGEIVILLLIQTGGMGFMLIAAMAMVASGKRISLKSRALLRDSMGLEGLGGSVRLSMRFFLIVLAAEMAGGVLLSVRFVPDLGAARGVYYGFFHAVSAFCNAGFDLFGTSLQGYSDDGFVLFIVALLIVSGGLGFAVLSELLRRQKNRKLSLHTKSVLMMTGALLAGGMMVFALIEWRNPETLGAMPVPQKILNAAFQSVTARTAGFYSFEQSGLTDAGKMVTSALMLIGASPVSTGGGVKTTTVLLLAASVLSVMRGRETVTAFKREISVGLVRTALCIMIIFTVLLFSGTVFLSLMAPGIDTVDLMYETASALGTAGLTAAGTARVPLPGRLMLIVFMYIGRVGPFTMMLALMRRLSMKQDIHYPKENMLVG